MLKLMSFLQKTKIAPKPPLGRWNLLSCDVALERRIALANTDHCGPCSFEDIQRPYFSSFETQ